MMELNENIREIRRSRGLTQEALADIMGVSAASVSKWENGQCVPEIGALIAMADYFEVSVDMLLGHLVQTDRQKKLLDEMQTAADMGDFDTARALGQKLLRNYPNSYTVVDQVAKMYYQSMIVTGDRASMETAIELVHRLLSMADRDDKLRLELRRRIANQYELLGNWEMAKRYYEQSNVNGVNDGNLAVILAQEKGGKEAIQAISKEFCERLFYLIAYCQHLKNLWEAEGEADKARAAIHWAVTAFENTGASVANIYAPVGMSLYLGKACQEDALGNHAAAEESLRSAFRLIRREDKPIVGDFLLTEDDIQVIATQALADENGLKEILTQLGLERYIHSV